MNNEITFREAVEQDLESIVKMLSDDLLGSKRERYELPLPSSYVKAFKAIETDPNNELVVVNYEHKIVGVLQITFTPYITHQGGWRATVEGVRISSDVRGMGAGSQMIEYAIQRAKERECHLIQLTTDKQREDALRFYERLGFHATHEGFKMKL
ncbi:MAG TPA: GNAT family N-acetyltransferase [Aliicoccus persicus]|uniref:GNAT family N-acetyltransferase n=1 Tax=Aliicoccus persicus TaxID=930138 RepID=A0A921DWV6_9STAP|nr:GNAT family N-acetyltransferase [Aliicoccus persicus]